MTLAQLKAEAAVETEAQGGIMGAVFDVIKKIFNRLFGPDTKPPAPPLYEVMGTDVNLISANKHAEGKGAGGGGGGGGGDGWLGNMPGLSTFKPIFSSQTDVESTNAEGDTADEMHAQSEAENKVEAEVEAEAESKSDLDAESEATAEVETPTSEE